MGTIEEKGRKRKRKRDIKYAVLATIKVSALVGVTLMAPNLPKALYKLGLIPKGSHDAGVISRARRQLLDTKLLEIRDGAYRLTDRGKATLGVLEMQYTTSEKRKWDGRWRVLMFDVPEYRKSVRDKIRKTLMHIGFVRLQDSVWVYPYDCEDLITLLKADFRIGKDVLYMIVDEMEGDSKLRSHFGLRAS